MITDQFLISMDNHALRVQAATSGSRRIENALLCIARSLEAVSKEHTDGKLGSALYKPVLLLGMMRL